jgi:hypothetical protein
MVEAVQSLSQIPTQAQLRITTAAHVLAMLRSRQAVKRELQKQGLKPAHYSAREIISWSMLYLEDHATELMPEAIARARAMIASGALGKRAQRELRAELTSDAQRTKA